MKLRDEDKKLLQGEVSRAVNEATSALIDTLKPHGWRRVTHTLREWGILGSIITAFISLFGITLGAAYVATARVSKQATFESETTNKLAALGSRLDKIDATLTAFQIASLSDKAITDKSASEAEKILTDAQMASMKLPQSVVQESAEKYVTAAKYVPAAWETALAFVNYSSLRNLETVKIPAITPGPPPTHYAMQIPKGHNPPIFGTAGISSKEAAAQFNAIGKDIDAGSTTGATVIVGQGGYLVLDGMQMKNIILIGVHVVYSGGPVKIENVQFVNCVFEMPHTKNGEGLALAELQPSTTVNFDTLG